MAKKIPANPPKDPKLPRRKFIPKEAKTPLAAKLAKLRKNKCHRHEAKVKLRGASDDPILTPFFVAPIKGLCTKRRRLGNDVIGRTRLVA